MGSRSACQLFKGLTEFIECISSMCQISTRHPHVLSKDVCIWFYFKPICPHYLERKFNKPYDSISKLAQLFGNKKCNNSNPMEDYTKHPDNSIKEKDGSFNDNMC